MSPRNRDSSLFVRPARLVVHVSGMAEPLIDASLRQADRKTEIWHYDSDEVWTPLSLPLRVSVHAGYKSGLQVWTAQTKLVQAAVPSPLVEVELLLPSDEMLYISVRHAIAGDQDTDAGE